MDSLLILKFFSAFVLVIAMMLLFAWGLKRMGLMGAVTPLNSKRRLKVVEFLPVDHRRKLVLVRRDDKEHLLLLSSQSEIVVETNIVADLSKGNENVQN